MLEKILGRVQKPARYAGGEWNAVIKDWSKTAVKVAFAFPDVYEVGMSHLGLQILYQVVNDLDYALLERVFAPWPDMEEQLRSHGFPLFSLESRRALSDFDIVAFTLQYELTYTNILNMLDLAGIPVLAKDRGENDPLVIAGGPCAYNPEPLADFIDAFVIGEGEEVIVELLNSYRANAGLGKRELLQSLGRLDGVYVPSFYSVEYHQDGRVASIQPVVKGMPEKVKKRVVRDLDAVPLPVKPVVPGIEAVHDRAMVEIFRGCTHGCRFCQAGIIYRPVRERSRDTIFKAATELLKNTGYDELSLVSLSTTDYSGIGGLMRSILDVHGPGGVNVSLPSLRVDAFAVDLAKEARRVRRGSLTFAPEAGTQRLRDIINKGVSEDDLMQAVTSAFKAGWQAVKLYFMIGLPKETREDLDGIAQLARQVVEAGLACGVPPGRLRVTVSASSFVPKAHSVFQWEGQDSQALLQEKQAYLKDRLRLRHVVFHWHDPETSFLEAVLARGDRRLGRAVQLAWQLGCRFDGWTEWFKPDLWQQAFREAGLDEKWYAYHRYSFDDTLPWEHIDTGVEKSFLISEYRRAMDGEKTDDCRSGPCQGCGLCTALEVERVLASRP